MQLLETLGVLGRGRNSDKEQKNEFPCIKHDSDYVQPSPCYQQGAWDLDYSECTKPRGAHVGCGGLRPRGPWGREGVITRRLKGGVRKFAYAAHAFSLLNRQRN